MKTVKVYESKLNISCPEKPITGFSFHDKSAYGTANGAFYFYVGINRRLQTYTERK